VTASPGADPFQAFADRMEAESLPPSFVASFARFYRMVTVGQTGHIAESDIRPIADLPDASELEAPFAEIGRRALDRVAVIKLNGGLGTSMGLRKAKSLLVVKDGLAFLDIVARQALAIGVPLVLMDSFATEADTRAALRRYPDLQGRLPLTFLQHKAPKIVRADLSPALYPDDPELEWCPPGHGDLYSALLASGTLDALLDAGRDYAFVSNADNLGAVIDLGILGYFDAQRVPFLMEVTLRTEMDRKGGHLALSREGRLILRESAQCRVADLEAFQDIGRHRFFNTNNLWIDLRKLRQVMVENNGFLALPMILNAKTVDPRDPDSTPVWQVETAMGAAISVFSGARAVNVPRTRFVPVKSTEDLLAVRSDAYVLSPELRLEVNPDRRYGPLGVELDPAHYCMLTAFEERFPQGVPSLVDCRRCRIIGDFRFGRDVRFVDDVELVNQSGRPVTVADGMTVRGDAGCARQP
jgi:UTP--glucose-1-phosphate uridylyltransferase